MTSQDDWTAVDRYVTQLFGLSDDAFDMVLRRSREHDLPDIQISHPQGQFLYVLARATGARRILEIGTLAGFSTIFLARAVPEGGVVYTLELDSTHAAVARENFAEAGVSGVVHLLEGDAHGLLERMKADEWEPFDFVFLDADKPGYPTYLEAMLPLCRQGTLIVADNVVREGKVADADSADPNVRGVREFNALLAADRRLRSTVLQTVGTKGYDGFAVAVVV